MRISPHRLIVLATLLLGTCWGCGSGSGKLPDLIAVKGKVTYKGQPLTKGTIRFEPDGFGRMASGNLQSDGTFVLSTLKDGDGVVAGHHRVFVSDVDKNLAKDRAFKKYTQATTSKEEVDVDPEHSEFNFDFK